MKTTKDFVKQISKNGLYIILFLCISAIGIAGYVMYHSSEPEVPVNQIVPDIPDKVTIDPYEPIELPEATAKMEETEKTVAKTEPIKESEEPQGFVTAVSGKVLNPFSGDEMVKSKTFNDWRTHAGIDIAADEGSEVYAIAGGTVEKVFEDEMMGYTVVISHRDGITSTYCNLMKGVVVKVGQKVKAGDVIGGVGKSAMAESAEVSHLHLETTKNGEQIDPMSLIE